MKKSILALLYCTSPCLAYEGAEELLASMSLREKIGQLCVVASIIDEKRDPNILEIWKEQQPLHDISIDYVERSITEEHVGGVVFFGRRALPEKLLALTHHFQSLSAHPLLFALDAEVGLGQRLNNASTMRFPTPMTLAATQDLDLIYQVGYAIGEQLKAVGIQVNFAPVADINTNPNNPVIGIRSFGSDKEATARLAIAYMNGLQDAGIIACAKHFPGHGDTEKDSHQELPLILNPLSYLENNDLYPFQKLIDAGVKSVMTAHLEVPALEAEKGLPASLSKTVVNALLREKMGFDGLIFTDALGMRGVTAHFEPGEIELKALLAGNDVLLCPIDPKKAIDRIERAVLDGEISLEEIDKKALKILKAKQSAPLLPIEENLFEKLQPADALALRRNLFEKAITLLKPASADFSLLSQEKTFVLNTDPLLTHFEESLKELLPLIHCANLDSSCVLGAKHIVIALSSDSYKSEDLQTLIAVVHQLKEWDKIVTLVHFCSPYLAPPLAEADHIIFAYETQEDAQRAAAEVLAGIRTPTGILPVSLAPLNLPNQEL